jgi:hypothetical protein
MSACIRRRPPLDDLARMRLAEPQAGRASANLECLALRGRGRKQPGMSGGPRY